MTTSSAEFSYPNMIDAAERLGCYRWAEQLRENYYSESTRDKSDADVDDTAGVQA